MAVTLKQTIPSFERHLRALNRSPATVKLYGLALRKLTGYLGDRDIETITSDDLKGFIAESLNVSAATAKSRHTATRSFFAWAAREGEIPTSPAVSVMAPFVPEPRTEILTPGQIEALLRDCAGNTLEARRDRAIISFLADTGARIGECAGLRVSDVDLDSGTARVLGKGRRERVVPLGAKLVAELDRYLRARRGSKWAHLPWLWVGRGGRYDTAIPGMLKRRGARAGIPGLHAHQFRHTAAHEWLSAGGSEGDLATLGGWRSPTVMRRYGSTAAGARAIEAHRRLSLRDRLG